MTTLNPRAAWCVVAVFLAFGTGCGGSSSEGEPSGAAVEETEGASTANFMESMAELAEAACACRDRACAEAVNARIEALIEVTDEAPEEVSEEDMKAAMMSMFNAIQCLRNQGV